MNPKFLLQIIAAATLGWGCDNISEKAGPDSLAGLSNANKEYILDGPGPHSILLTQGIASLSALKVTITKQAVHGTISLETDGRILYRPAPGFYSGLDSAMYQICNDARCLDGRILIQLSDSNACLPVVEELVIETNTGGPYEIQIPNEFGCGAIKSSIFGNQAFSLLDGKIFGTFPENKIDTNSFNLVACSNAGRCDTGIITVISGRQNCFNRFSLKNDTFLFNRNFTEISINLNLLLSNDTYCINDLLRKSLGINQPPTRGIAIIRNNVQGDFIRFVRNPNFTNGLDSLTISLQTISGAEKTSKLYILTP